MKAEAKHCVRFFRLASMQREVFPALREVLAKFKITDWPAEGLTFEYALALQYIP